MFIEEKWKVSFIYLNLFYLSLTWYAYTDFALHSNYQFVTSYIRPHFVRWSKVRTTYDDDDDEIYEASDSGSEVSDDDFVDTNTKDMIDDDMMVTVEDLDFNPDLNKMSITPKNSSKFVRMPARIRPSTSPESLWTIGVQCYEGVNSKETGFEVILHSSA